MKNPNRTLILLLITFSSFISSINSQTTYYSRNATSGGNWKSTNSWTTNSDGSGAAASSVPQRNDHVVVLNGHEIKISGTTDNGSSAVKPDNVSDPDGNIGPFNGSNAKMFYHTGDITIESGATLDINTKIMLSGSTAVSGTFETNGDFVNLGRLDVYSGSLNIGDDFILSGNSETNIDISAFSVDDIYFDNTGAKLCGLGDVTVNDIIQDLNGANPSTQVCSGYAITYDRGSEVFYGEGLFALPVELYTYKVKLEDNNVRIEWSTASELNNDYFVVERSVDVQHFEEIGRKEGAGNSDDFRYYAITDRFPFEGVSYYRLKQVDFDGTETYFDLKIVENKNGYTDEHGISVFPNPIMEHDKFNIGLEGFKNKTVQVKIQNISGFMIYTNEINITKEREHIELETAIIQDSGMYVMSVYSGSKWYYQSFHFLK